MIRSDDLRMVYANAVIALKKQGVDLEKARLSQSVLRFEVILEANKTDYLFPILENQTINGVPQGPNEVRIPLQDSFYVSHLSYHIVVDTSHGTADRLGRFAPMTYPDTNNIDSGSLSTTSYQLWYGAYLSLTVNNNVYIPVWDCARHLFVPETQQQAYVGPAPNQFYNRFNQLDFSQDSFYPVEPNVVIIGSTNTKLALNFPESLAAALPSASAVVKAVVMVRGVLAQNSTSVT